MLEKSDNLIGRESNCWW